MDIGRVGVWTFALDLQPAAKAQAAAAEIEELGYGAIWIPEAIGREPLTSAGLLLAATRRIVLATGIASIWARDPMAMAAGQKTLTEAYPELFLLGLGVSHAPMVGLRGHNYDKPLNAHAPVSQCHGLRPIRGEPTDNRSETHHRGARAEDVAPCRGA